MWPRLLLAFLMTAGLTAVHTATAAESDAPDITHPIYFGVGFGLSHFSDDDQFKNQSLDDTDFGLLFQVGAHFNHLVSVEFGYRNYGEFEVKVPGTGERGDVEAWATTLSAIFSIPLADRLYLTPRAGVASVRYKQTLPLSRISEPGLVFGAGLRLRISDNVEIEGLLESLYYELEAVELIATESGIRIRERDLDQLMTLLTFNANLRF